MLSLTGSYCLTEMVTGVYLDSLALQSDAMHMLSDALALIVGLVATIVGRRQTGAATARVDAVGGLVNGVFLLSGLGCCLLYTSPSPRDRSLSRMPSSA